ncbi:hypothetical protein E2L08_10345 [Palleronia sediminis]|uniref:DsrE/DsrF-like family protein n=1 Tax=Palleronia sediminis TaxID=2547833 RepID=A0A4R6A9C2_9RHOB|nr:hypothetical protein [Palleronia sediminis]TDL79412.1 hypothetical protein E2L08_10345 [Palleronia sediminis]
MTRFASAAAAILLAATPALAQDKAPVAVIVTSGDAQVQLMSMVLTMQSARQGAATRVLLCGPAGDMALRDAPETATAGQPPRDMSPQGLMQTIMGETETTVEVCAIYLPGKGLEPSALIDGVTVADPAEIGAAIVDPGTKFVSF